MERFYVEYQKADLEFFRALFESEKYEMHKLIFQLSFFSGEEGKEGLIEPVDMEELKINSLTPVTAIPHLGERKDIRLATFQELLTYWRTFSVKERQLTALGSYFVDKEGGKYYPVIIDDQYKDRNTRYEIVWRTIIRLKGERDILNRDARHLVVAINTIK